jgi:hypothetical protein
MISLSIAEMRVVKRTSTEAATYFAAMTPAAVKPSAQGTPQVRFSDDGASSTRAVIASSFFIVFIVAALLVGGHAAIDPFLHPALEAQDEQAAGDVVVSMPDGRFCRHMSFDNATASVVEGPVELCQGDIVRDHGLQPSAPRGFAWGLH